MAAHVRSVTLSIWSRLNRSLNLSQISLQRKDYFKCLQRAPCTFIHTTNAKFDLKEFFDDPKNWGAEEVKSGRSWTVDELRNKSNVDLQKLWYVLLKERNMLLTMEHNCKEECELFPSPERLDKVEDSMKRIELVVHERNDAYWQLEIGEPAPKPREVFELDPSDPLALVRKAITAAGFDEVKERQTIKFQYLLKEKERKLLRRQLRLQNREAIGLLKRFPNLDMEALQEKYPDVNVEKLKFNKRTRGHHNFNTA